MEFIAAIVLIVLFSKAIGWEISWAKDSTIRGLKLAASLVRKEIGWVTGSGGKSVETEKSLSETLANLPKFDQRLVAELVAPAYVLTTGEKEQVIIPAKVKIFFTQNQGT